MFEYCNWSKSVKNKDISFYSSLEINSLNNYILFVGGVHGDEPEGIQLANNLLNYLKLNSVKYNWALIPCINPDGAHSKSRTNANGVDLNRNFNSKDWSTGFTKPRYFPGNQPNSEPETQALSQLINNTKPDLVMHFHSWKPSIVLTGPKNYQPAELFSKTSNYELQHDIGYPTPGSLGQYCWLNLQIPVICIEEAEGAEPNKSWKRFKPAFESLLKKTQF